MVATCGAHARSTGKPCTRPVAEGKTRCRFHGGAAPQVKAAAAHRDATEKARHIMETYGRKVDTDPIEALLDEVRWTAGHVAWLRDRVREVETEALVWGRTETVDKSASEFPGTDTTEAAKPNAWLVLYWQERKHLVDVCKATLQAGVEERRVRLAEAQGALIVQVIRGILDELGLNPEQATKAADIVPRHLRAIAA